ncbi:MAG: hypothetical protein ACR2NW_08805 [Thermodesulfobacteriota bacterium]
MGKKLRFSFIGITLVLLFTILTGCASLYGNSTYSIITPEVQTSAPGQNKVNITIRTNVWKGTPNDLSGYLTPLFIEITNNTDKPISISYNDFVLIDDNRNQYNAVIPEMASDIVAQKSKNKWYFRPSISIGIGTGGYYRRGYGYGIGYYNRGYPYYRSPFYWPYNSAYYSDYYDSYYYNQDYSDVFTQALVPGVIRPNARLSGFIYFKKLPPTVKSFTMDVGYKVEGEDKRYDLSFPYSVVMFQK